MMKPATGVFCVWVGLFVPGCGNVGHDDDPPKDGSMESPGNDAPAIDGATIDALSAEPGTREHPARSCAELAVAGLPSGAYWVRHPADATSTFQAYCEQTLNGGGWAMLENSVRRDDGTTTTFWQFKYDDRLSERGVLAPDQNYYNGALYQIGTQYMDVFVDLHDTLKVAALMTATGINPTTMRLIEPKHIGGSINVYGAQFASGWSASDKDIDVWEDAEMNCALRFGHIAQHYSACFAYNLGADGEAPVEDGGVGPHVSNEVLTSLGLALQDGGGGFSQVKRIARFTRW